MLHRRTYYRKETSLISTILTSRASTVVYPANSYNMQLLHPLTSTQESHAVTLYTSGLLGFVLGEQLVKKYVYSEEQRLSADSFRPPRVTSEKASFPRAHLLGEENDMVRCTGNFSCFHFLLREVGTAEMEMHCKRGRDLI